MVTTSALYNCIGRFPSDGLRKLRAYLKVTEKTSDKGPQVDLAKLADIPIGTLNHIIHGRRRPNLVHAMKLKKACGSVGILIEMEDWAMKDERKILKQIDKQSTKVKAGED